jgi:hypothetical protein
MDGRKGAADQAVARTLAFLRSFPQTESAVSVEQDPTYRKRDIDVLWRHQGREEAIEVKGDTQGHRTGNYAFETVSNEERGTPGCFLYSEAKWLHYHFLSPCTLHVMDLAQVRNWFVSRQQEFRLFRTQTTVGNGRYTTVGRLVPLDQLRTALPQAIEVHNLSEPER